MTTPDPAAAITITESLPARYKRWALCWIADVDESDGEYLQRARENWKVVKSLEEVPGKVSNDPKLMSQLLTDIDALQEKLAAATTRAEELSTRLDKVSARSENRQRLLRQCLDARGVDWPEALIEVIDKERAERAEARREVEQLRDHLDRGGTLVAYLAKGAVVANKTVTSVNTADVSALEMWARGITALEVATPTAATGERCKAASLEDCARCGQFREHGHDERCTSQRKPAPAPPVEPAAPTAGGEGEATTAGDGHFVGGMPRVGRKQARNIYIGDDYVGVAFREQDARLIVTALTEYARPCNPPPPEAGPWEPKVGRRAKVRTASHVGVIGHVVKSERRAKFIGGGVWWDFDQLEPEVEAEGVALRPVVRWFAEQMESKLRDNDHKGGWHECDPAWLLKRSRQELREVEGALVRVGLKHGGLDDADLIAECADVANMVMMLADHFREGGPSRDSGRALEAAEQALKAEPARGGGRG